MRPSLWSLLVLAGCGRVGFDPLGGEQSGTTDAAGAGNGDAALDSALVLWLAFEDDLTDGAFDGSIDHNNASCGSIRCPITDLGVHGSGSRFDGAGASLVSLLTPPVGDNTWEVWVNPTSTQTFAALLLSRGTSDTPGGQEINLLGGVFETWSNGTRYSTATMITPGTWTHLATTRTGSSLSVYVNGALIQTGSDSLAHDFAGCPTLIGVASDVGCTGNLNGYYDGMLDEVRMYSRALSAQEIIDDMNSALPR